jgi:mannose-1-phosphate guanylyltransferase
MKFIIFAGGTGTRLWPLSRKGLPKQFIRIFNGKSTLQLAFERIKGLSEGSDIYISTNRDYVPLVKEQLPTLPDHNIVGEPEKRNVGPAVGYNLIRLRKEGYSGPVAILWADHLMDNVDNFIEVLEKGETLVKENPQQLVFIGETPRYAENNLGWIHVGKKINDHMHEFVEWFYRPPPETCVRMFESGEWFWNPGYFVVDLKFTLSLYEKHVPTMYQHLEKIENALGTPDEEEKINRTYPQLEPLHFDRIVETVPPHQAVVLVADLGWSDPGSFYALKEALSRSKKENITRGLTFELDTTDSLIINQEKGKLVATIGLDGVIVVNTPDAVLVVHKDDAFKVGTGG